ncbi:MAG TPA: hypothetical protein DDY32_01825 [Desulfobulbaceae bacterium]|nr:hypothetical protein [Desulfobulbaceae bacterium]
MFLFNAEFRTTIDPQIENTIEGPDTFFIIPLAMTAFTPGRLNAKSRNLRTTQLFIAPLFWQSKTLLCIFAYHPGVVIAFDSAAMTAKHSKLRILAFCVSQSITGAVGQTQRQ